MKSVSSELMHPCHFEAPSDSPNFLIVIYCLLKVTRIYNDEIFGICQISLTCGRQPVEDYQSVRCIKKNPHGFYLAYSRIYEVTLIF